MNEKATTQGDDEMPKWTIKNRATGEVVTGTKPLAMLARMFGTRALWAVGDPRDCGTLTVCRNGGRVLGDVVCYCEGA